MKLVDNSSLVLTHAPPSKRSQEANVSESSRVGQYLSLFADGAADRVQEFTMLRRERGTDVEMLPSEILPESFVTWSSDKYFRSRHAVLAEMHHLGEIKSPQASDMGVLATSPDYYVDMDGESLWDFVNLDVVDKSPLEHTVMKAKFTKLPVACLLSDITVHSFVIDVIDFVPECVSASGAGDYFPR